MERQRLPGYRALLKPIWATSLGSEAQQAIFYRLENALGVISRRRNYEEVSSKDEIFEMRKASFELAVSSPALPSATSSKIKANNHVYHPFSLQRTNCSKSLSSTKSTKTGLLKSIEWFWTELSTTSTILLVASNRVDTTRILCRCNIPPISTLYTKTGIQ